MPIFNVGAAGTTSSGYEVDNSLRFNSGSSDYLTHTHGAVTSTRKQTFSVWVKRASALGSYQYIISTKNGTGTNRDGIAFSGSNQIDIRYNAGGTSPIRLTTNRLFRDVSAWLHIVVAVDTTQSTDSNRIKLYVNGVQETSFATSDYMSQNYDFALNAKTDEATGIGVDGRIDGTSLFDGYMSEFVGIDNQQLDATSFGEFDEDSGIWKPIDVSGLTFGSAGFYLDFEDSSALGNDVSGNNNDFASSGLSALDQSTDTPTNNYSTLNSLANTPSTTFTEGNLKATISGTHVSNYGTQLFETGKWYFEAKATGGSKYTIGMTNVENASAYQQVAGTNNIVGYHANSYLEGDAIGLYYDTIRKNGSVVASGLHQWVTNDIAMVAIDADNGKIWFGANGTWDNSGDPAAGSGNRTTFATGQLYIPAISNENCNWEMNFGGGTSFSISSGNSDGNGHGNFEYAVPSGFYAINTKNLAEFG
tara:strand:+ start:984 stop:2411 length:1428 start_codon:yes stop_codon:yes gene_type:complete